LLVVLRAARALDTLAEGPRCSQALAAETRVKKTALATAEPDEERKQAYLRIVRALKAAMSLRRGK